MENQIFENKLKNVAVIGCGNVGATTAYTLMKTAWFQKMVLIDVNQRKAEGEAEDLRHGLPFQTPMEIEAGDYEKLADCGLIIITAGENQKPGETRLDLLRTNANIFRSIVKNVLEYNRDAILLVVTNPVDVLTYVTLNASGFPKERAIGSGTVLDTARLKQLLGEKWGVDGRNIHSFIIGEHGDSEFPVWSSANVSGIDLPDFCNHTRYGYHPEELERIFHEVKTSAYRIIEAKGATFYAIAEAVKRIVSAIVHDENSILSVSTLMQGEYGIEDVAMSMPCILGKTGIRKVLEIPLDTTEDERLHRSAATLKQAVKQLDFAGESF